MPLPVPLNPPAPLSLEIGELSINNNTRAAYVGVPTSIHADGWVLVSAIVETTAQIDLKADAGATTSALALKAALASPAFTGTPTAPTAAPGTNTTQLATTAFVAASVVLSGSVPIGGIILWSGSIAVIPAGWVICNGANGTPDLRDKFVIGAGSTYSVAAVGGAASVEPSTSEDGGHSHGGETNNFELLITHMPSHGHTLANVAHTHTTNENTGTKHEHGISFNTSAAAPGSGINAITSILATGGGGGSSFTLPVATGIVIATNAMTNAAANVTGGGNAHKHTINSDGGHTHTVNVPTMPPYYALAYIQKLP